MTIYVHVAPPTCRHTRQCSKYNHDVQLRQMWETPLKQSYRINALFCSFEAEPTNSSLSARDWILQSYGFVKFVYSSPFSSLYLQLRSKQNRSEYAKNFKKVQLRSGDDISLKNFGQIHRVWISSLSPEVQVSGLGLGIFISLHHASQSLRSRQHHCLGDTV